MWRPPVFDRTQQDVINRRTKGAINASDLNRIDGNSKFLSILLRVSIETREWSMADFPTAYEQARISINAQTLRDVYYTYPDTPPTPSPPLNTWQKINDLEKILHDLHELYSKNKDTGTYTGEIFAGDSIGVI